MSVLTSRFTQSPAEIRRYIINYALELASGETVTGLTATITSPTGGDPTHFLINNIVLGPDGTLAFFYASLGDVNQSYEVSLKATTSLSQEFEDIAQFDIKSKV